MTPDALAFRSILAVHVGAATTWVGGGLLLSLQGEKARKSGDLKGIVAVAAGSEHWAKKLFVPASVVLLICGIAMAALAHVWDKPFVMVGMAGWLISFAIGVGYLSRKGAHVKALVAAEGEDSQQAASASLQMLKVAEIDMAILFIVVLFMAVQPWGNI